MKTVYGISIFVILSATQLVYGGTLTVTTNKQVYSPGEQITIFTTASGFPYQLTFPTSCQADYIMDGNYDSGSGVVCLQIVTSVILPHTWTKTHNWSRYSPGIGTHTVIAYLNDPWGSYFTSNCASFEVVQPFRLISPNGGEHFVAGSTMTLLWQDHESDVFYDLNYSVDNGQNWQPIASSLSGYSHQWTIPNSIHSNQCLVKVIKMANPNVEALSGNLFTIFECQGPIDGDLNSDCYVNYLEYSIVAKNWMRSDCAEGNDWCDYSDIYPDGAVDIQDLIRLAEYWLMCGNPFDPSCLY